MQLLGQKATNCLHTTFISFSRTAMSLSWLPSGVTVTYTHSTCAPIAATVEALSECGQSMAIKYEVNGRVVHHPRDPPRNISNYPEPIKK